MIELINTLLVGAWVIIAMLISIYYLNTNGKLPIIARQLIYAVAIIGLVLAAGSDWPLAKEIVCPN